MSGKKKDDTDHSLSVPMTKCTTRTNSTIVQTKHGAVRVEVKSPVKQ